MLTKNHEFYKATLIFLWLIFMLLWAVSFLCSKIISRRWIRSKLKKNSEIKGRLVDYWLKDITYPVEYSFDISESNVISFKNNDFFLVEAEINVITFNQIKFGVGMSHYKCWCVLAVGNDAIEILNNKRSLFKKISIDQNNEIGLFSIRKLFSFACLLRRESQRCVGEGQ
ncbi:MAG: hypothetical protein WC340_15395 [Kiritimatiellia bacterium]